MKKKATIRITKTKKPAPPQSMPTKNIWWKDVTDEHRVDLRRWPQGNGSSFVAISPSGEEAMVYWCSQTVREAHSLMSARAAKGR